MPYSAISELPKQVKSLPLKAKKIWLKAFNASYHKYGEESAIKIAWSAVKKKYTKNKKGVWVTKSTVKAKAVISKSGFFIPSYYFDAVLTSSTLDEDGQKVSPVLIKSIMHNIDENGDIEHLKVFGDNRFNGVFKLIKKELDGDKLKIRFTINKAHPKYKNVLNLIKKYNHLGLSAEFYNPQVDEEGNIINAEGLGWSVVVNPANPDSYFLAM